MKTKKILVVILSLIVVSLFAYLMTIDKKETQSTTVVKEDIPVSSTDTSETPVTNEDGSPSTFVPDKREEIDDDEIFFAYTKGEDVKQDNLKDNSSEDVKQDNLKDNSHITNEPEKGNNVDEQSGIILDSNELEILNY